MTRTLALSLVVVALGGACTHARQPSSSQQAQAAPAAPAPGAPAGMADRCPMSVPGTRVASADTPTGEALIFTTTPDRVGALRERVHAMAEMHNARHAGAAAAGGTGSGMTPGLHGDRGMGAGEQMGGDAMGGMMMPPATQVSVEDIPEGARLTVTPGYPGDLPSLQSKVRMHAIRMQREGCGTMR